MRPKQKDQHSVLFFQTREMRLVAMTNNLLINMNKDSLSIGRKLIKVGFSTVKI